MTQSFVLFQAISEVKTKLLGALSDDFDTATAMSAITELVGVTNKMLHQKSEHVSICYIFLASCMYIILHITYKKDSVNSGQQLAKLFTVVPCTC